MNPVSSEAATLRTFSQGRAQMLKRALDISGSFLLLIALWPVFLIIAVLILISDGAPVTYRRRVIGPAGEFDAFKFRTMRRDADELLRQNAPLHRTFSENFKLKSDPRVTALGAVLRKFSLDELPQLYNVLRGQMSLVGPRMITAPELDKYGEYRDLLLRMKPGLTGYWQVHGRQEVSYAERVRMDIDYIQNWNLRMDIHLLVLTPARVIRGRGAY